MSWLELKVPPVLLLMIFAGVMSSFFYLTNSGSYYVPYALAGSLLFCAVGAWLLVLAVFQFRISRTTVNPVKPEDSSALVVSGIYRYTRNPMYLGFLCLLIALAVYLQNIYVWVGPVIFVFYLNRFQILPEERIMAQLFRQEYLGYKSKVRRWI